MLHPSTQLIDITGRLLLAALFGGVLGFEREIHHKAAGIRTNALIALGSALFTVLSFELTKAGGDPSRIASTIVTGMGFLGGGAILRTGHNVQGLTTAATMWVNAAIGMAVGGGNYGLAASATLITFIFLWLVGILERWFDRRVLKEQQRSD